MIARRWTISLIFISLAMAAGCASQTSPTEPPSPSQATRDAPEEKPPTPADDTASPQPARAADETSGSLDGTADEGADGEPDRPKSSSEGPDPTQPEAAADAAPPEAIPTADGSPAGPTTSAERTAELEEELDHSLQEFDGLLLDEQERLDRHTAEDRAGGSGDGAVGAGHTGRGGASAAETAGAETSDDAEAAGGKSPGSRQGAAGGENSGAVGGGGADGSDQGSRVPPDVGDGSDDDIIARQLREAAMAEEDPELRERLWEEYRTYKASVASAAEEDS